jgi:predicted enzyme related to lactoylglutathione lyase
LWTSDVAGSRRFYSELFGWEAQAPNAEFGGYFMFTRNGLPVAGGMGPMGDIPAGNLWQVYLATDDIAAALTAAEGRGAKIISPAMPVADMGVQAILDDPTGGHVGAWQAGSFAGFTVLDEPGAPNWFELLTRDHAAAVDFYRSVFGLEPNVVGDSDEFRYTTMRAPGSDTDLAGIMDAAGFLPAGVPSHWSVYWAVEDAGATAARAAELGGSVVRPAEDTPYGRLATAADPAGAQFKLRSNVK